MEKLAVKYLLEFLVIVIGISISFYAENYNDSLNKIQLKNQSLNRILENLKGDNGDNRFNYKTHSESLMSSEWILTNRNNLSAYSRDTIGFHLSRAINLITYFVDNQEEYKTIQNSGYIEYIENESLVKGLQGKYVQHKFMKFLEEEIRSKAKVLSDFEFKNSKINSDSLYMGSYLIYKTYIGDMEIPNEFYDRIIEKASYQKIYLGFIKRRIQRDSILENEINKEILVN
mgnify:FL=1|tara:strand:- start:875 stop:1564 length:690 start_codon:yes stop_codon:yes gene_type:complete